MNASPANSGGPGEIIIEQRVSIDKVEGRARLLHAHSYEVDDDRENTLVQGQGDSNRKLQVKDILGMSDGHIKLRKRREFMIEVIADELDPAYLKQTLRKRFRFLMLFFACGLILANYYCYDIPATMQIPLENTFGAQ